MPENDSLLAPNKCREIEFQFPKDQWLNAAYCYGLNKGRSGVAREIFDEIERHLREYQWRPNPDFDKRHYPYCPTDFEALKSRYLGCKNCLYCEPDCYKAISRGKKD